MPRTCTICVHPQRADIDRALVASDPLRMIGERFGVQMHAVWRHGKDHLPASLMKARDAAEVARADNLLDEVRFLHERALGLLTKAEEADQFIAAITAVREARACVELLAKLMQKLNEGPVVNLMVSPEWVRVRAALLGALAPYPEARAAVATTLAALDTGAA